MNSVRRRGWFFFSSWNVWHRRHLATSGTLAVLLLFGTTHVALAQRATKNPSDDKQLVKQLLQRIETLEGRLQQLESAGARTVAPQPEPPREVERSAAESPAVLSEAAVHEGHDGMSFEGMPTIQMRASWLRSPAPSVTYASTNSMSRSNRSA